VHLDLVAGAVKLVEIDAEHRLLARLLPKRRLVGEVGDVFLEPALGDPTISAGVTLHVAFHVGWSRRSFMEIGVTR
jgi:hypothetical protein